MTSLLSTRARTHVAVLLAPLFLACLGDDPGRRIVSAEDRRTFYRTGARELVGQRVHLHVEASVLRKKPRIYRAKDGRDRFEFENRTVPIDLDPRSPYWVQVSRHLDGADEFCVRGVVRIPEEDERGRAHLFVETIKRAAGSWK